MAEAWLVHTWGSEKRCRRACIWSSGMDGHPQVGVKECMRGSGQRLAGLGQFGRGRHTSRRGTAVKHTNG